MVELEKTRTRGLLPNFWWYAMVVGMSVAFGYMTLNWFWECVVLFFYPIYVFCIGYAKTQEYAPDYQMPT